MSERKRIIIFSHGFGVRKDDRGLFNDITAAFPDAGTVMFDYNKIDEQNNILTARPFSEQAEILKKVVEEQKNIAPNAIMDLVCHSQGSIVAAITKPSGIRKAILIAPPTDISVERVLERYKENPKAEINLEGVTKLPRTDGSTTIVPAEYWRERKGSALPIDLYNELAEVTKLSIIKAKQDNVLGDTSFEGLDKKIKVIELDGDHDFTQSRINLIEVVKDILC